jgi:hypothetical protein
MEAWKLIPHAPQYLCSNFGQVKSLRFQKPLKGDVNNCGYIRVQLGSYKNKHFVHRLVAECFLDKPSFLEYVNHKDGNKQNNCASNLEWCTQKENTTHAVKSGLRTSLKGEQHPGAKLSQSNVVKIKTMLAAGVSCAQIASCFGVNRKTISDIKNQKTWAHLTSTHGS